MTTSTTPATAAWLGDWRRWRAERNALALAPHGLASVTGTHWLGDEPEAIDGLPGRWAAVAGHAVADGPGDLHLELDPGTAVAVGELLIQPLGRAGRVAVRVFDPQAATRTAIEGIDAFDPDPAWVVEGRADIGTQPLRLDHIDGFVSSNSAAQVHVRVRGREQALWGTLAPNSDIQITFADTTNGTETERFRFLTVPAADENGRVTVDFNRAYLPPCTFTDHYLCPLPPAGNRLDFPVRVGETRVRRNGSAPR
ncbi:DUF1684 domain-containing protein [Nocardia sp. NPDC004860]|uniref:DUF1684 domain-containing protein n=1 Tax=Nocardia sp. NPDC004860 TaxID=3154557 RepID=UPI0033AD98D5